MQPSLALTTPFPTVHLIVAYGGENREATLVDPCVLFLLQQKKEEGMILSSSLGDILAPQMGVKVLWSCTNQSEIVQASSIRIINSFNAQNEEQNHSMRSGEFSMDRKRLISTLRESDPMRNQFLPQGLSPNIENTSNFCNESFNNKRRKLENYSNWFQPSISPDPLPSSFAPMGSFLNSNQLLKQHQHHHQQQQQQQQQQEKSNRSMMMANNSQQMANESTIDDEDQLLQRLLSAKRSVQTGISSNQMNKLAEKTVATDEKEWQYMYGRLVMYMKERGHEKVPARIQTDPDLRNWVAQQRLHFKKRNLSSNRQQLLRSVGIHQDKFTLKWEEKFERLQKFKKEHGHTNVPFHYAKDRQLGTWVSKQRVRLRNGTIAAEEKARLEAIGFVANRFNARWEEMFRRLVAYKRNYGDSNVPRVYEKDPQLAQWVLNQKDAFREGKMKPERQIKLEAIGFSWSTFYEGDSEWERNFQKLFAHKLKHGHTRFFDEQKLARWVALQQSLHSMGTLTDQRRELLVSVGVIPSNGHGNASAKTANLQTQEQQQIPMSAVPPMGLRQSFSEWRNPAMSTTGCFR